MMGEQRNSEREPTYRDSDDPELLCPKCLDRFR